VEGLELAVDVGHAHLIVVDEGQFANARPGQGFHTPAAHAAQSEDSHMGPGKFFHGSMAQEHLCPKELFVVHRNTS
jgi:hypothetical protein